jgi:hypothetical protein
MNSVRLKHKVWALSAVLLMGACASHETRVKCDGRLEPINAPAARQNPDVPAPAVQQTSRRTVTTPSKKKGSREDRP